MSSLVRVELWISSGIFHIVGILLCGGVFFIRYRRDTLEPEYWVGIIGILISFVRLLWILIQLGASTQPDEIKSAWISTMIYIVSLCLVKGSILVLYFRIHNRKSLILECVAGALLLYTLGIVVAIAIIISGEFPVKPAKLVVAQTVLQVILSFTLACLPSNTIWKLMIPVKSKIQITLVLLLGFLTIIPTIFGGIYRLAALTGIDSSLNWARVELAASIELAVSVTCLSFPAWKQAWKRRSKAGECAPKLRSTVIGLGERPNGQSGSGQGKAEGDEEARDTF